MWVCAECPTRAHHLMDQPASRLCTPSAGMDAQWARSAGGAVLGLLRAVGSTPCTSSPGVQGAESGHETRHTRGCLITLGGRWP